MARVPETALQVNTVLNDKKSNYQTAGNIVLLLGVVALLLVPDMIMLTIWANTTCR